VVLGEYVGATGEFLLVVAGATKSLAWRGRTLEEGTFEVLPGKGASDAG
jgi:hypothetical protein